MISFLGGLVVGAVGMALTLAAIVTAMNWGMPDEQLPLPGHLDCGPECAWCASRRAPRQPGPYS